MRKLENYQHVSPEANVSCFYLLFFRDWNAVFQYHTIQCLLIFCNTYHRQPSVCFTEASRCMIKYDGKRYPSQFVVAVVVASCSKILEDMLHNMSIPVLLPWQHRPVPDLPDIKGFDGHLWLSILIFANGASSP